MRHNDIRNVLNKRPFQRLKLSTSDGNLVEISHPDQVMISPSSLAIGLNMRGDRAVDDFLFVSCNHIVSVEEMSA